MAKDTITLRDVYDIANRLENKVDERMGKLETRTERLEGNQNKAFGVLSVFSIFIGAASTFIWEKVFGKG